MSSTLSEAASAQNLRDNLRAVRALRGMTLDELAKRCGVTRTTAHNWGAGKAVPSMAMLDCIARALNVTISELIAPPPYTSTA